MISYSLLSALLAISSVSAHGVVTKINLDGKSYPGPDPISADTATVAISPVRKIVNTSNGPAAGDLNSSNLACGVGALKAKVTADVTAGSTITTHWSDTWPHVAGPIITYLGKCDGDCTTTDATKVNFFKIDEVAFKDDGVTWVQADIHDKKDFAVTLPKNIPNGQYIFRQEIFALHLAQSAGGAELYPSCTQINVKGGTGSVPSETVQFPGAYKSNDPGLLVDIYNLKKGAYVMPGPKMTFPSRLSGAVGSTSSSSSGDNSSENDDDTTEDTTGDDTTGDNGSSNDDTTGDDDTEECSDDGDDETSADGDDDSSTPADDDSSDDTTADDGAEDDDETCSDEDDTTSDPVTPVKNGIDDSPSASGTSDAPAGNVSVTTITSAAVATSASASSTAPATTATVASSSSALDTGNKAIEMNAKFASMDASGSCTSGEVGCIGKLFAKCDHEKWVTWTCGSTSQCYAVPDAGSLSVVVTCDTTDDYLRRLQLTGAAPTKARMVKRHGRHRLNLGANTF